MRESTPRVGGRAPPFQNGKPTARRPPPATPVPATVPSEPAEPMPPSPTSRARGCLLGQLAGDALGSLVEFQSPAEIRRQYPEGVRDLAAGGTWNTLAGQPTDDSEMALLLARMLIERGTYEAEAALEAYQFWLHSEPFDCGQTIATALRGQLNPSSQANGALMRISPLGIFGANEPLGQVGAWAREDAGLTHPHPVCLQANALFAMALARAIDAGCGAEELYRDIREWAADPPVDPGLRETIDAAREEPPADYLRQQGWVRIAFGNALYQLLHAPTLEAGVIDTVQRGGDTDTNAAICGALLGAVHGWEAVPDRWRETVLSCRPQEGRPGVHRPRPACFWPVDALELADQLYARKGP